MRDYILERLFFGEICISIVRKTDDGGIELNIDDLID